MIKCGVLNDYSYLLWRAEEQCGGWSNYRSGTGTHNRRLFPRAGRAMRHYWSCHLHRCKSSYGDILISLNNQSINRRMMQRNC